MAQEKIKPISEFHGVNYSGYKIETDQEIIQLLIKKQAAML